MTRYWISWWGGNDGEPRPFAESEESPSFHWWVTGERFTTTDTYSICAVVDADDDQHAKQQITEWWPGVDEWRFCKTKPHYWMPDASRFPVEDTSP